MRQPSRKFNIFLSQLSILFISLVTAFIPQYYVYVFLAYFVIVMFILFRRTRVWSKIPSSRELGSPLFKETNVVRIAMLDAELMVEVKRQAMASLSLFMLTLLVLVVFPVYRATVFEITYSVLHSIAGNELIALFLAFLLMYEVLFGILTLARMAILSKLKYSNILLPQNFTIYRAGIVLNDRFFVRLESDKYCYEYNSKRRFVELRENKREGIRIRLYTDAVSELRDKIAELGIKSCA